MAAGLAPFLQGVIGGAPCNTTAGTLAKSGDCHLVGVLCNSVNSGTLGIYNGTGTNGNVVAGPFAVEAGVWYPMPFHLTRGCYIHIAGTADVTASVF